MEKLIEAWGLTCVYDVEQVAAEQDSAAGCAGLPQVVAVDGEQPLRARPAVRPAHVQADGTLPHFVPLRRHALLDALADLGGKPATVELDTRLWGHITIDMGKCRSCKMCAVFCPTGALQKYVGEGGHGGVEYYPAECVHCGCARTLPGWRHRQLDVRAHRCAGRRQNGALSHARSRLDHRPRPNPAQNDPANPQPGSAAQLLGMEMLAMLRRARCLSLSRFSRSQGLRPAAGRRCR